MRLNLCTNNHADVNTADPRLVNHMLPVMKFEKSARFKNLEDGIGPASWRCTHFTRSTLLFFGSHSL
jgi:hypothetical protein